MIGELWYAPLNRDVEEEIETVSVLVVGSETRLGGVQGVVVG